MLERVCDRLEAGPARAQALIWLSLVRGYDDDLRAAEALLREALHEAEGDEELVAAANNNLCAMLFRLRERLDEAVQHGEEASAAALDAGLAGIAAEAVGGRLLAEAALGRASAAATLQSALALQPGREHGRALAQPLFQVACAWLWWDDLDRAREAFEWLRQRAVEMGDEGSLPYVLVLAAQVDCVRGDVASAARHADEGYELTEQAGQATLGAYLLGARALADAIAGDAPHARQHAEQALAVADRTSGRPAEHLATTALGLLELSLGRPAEANLVLAPLVEFLRRERITEPGTARVVPDHVEGLIAVAELDAADELLGWYEGNAQRLQRRSALGRERPLPRAAGRGSGRSRWSPRPAQLCPRALRGRPDPAGARTYAARLRRRAPARQTQARGARSVGDGARHVRRHRRSLVGRACRRRAGPRRRPAPSAGALTATEQRVAELVAEGLQTKQVAAALFVSQKTVEGHLTHIYGKLGVRSRTELARRLG